MSATLPNLNHSFIFPVPFPDPVPDPVPDFRVFHTPIFNGFLLKMLLRSLPVYILKQLFFSISVNSGRIFTSPPPRLRRIIVNYLPS